MSVTGSAKLTHWTGKDGETRTGLDVIAAAILRPYQIKRKWQAIRGENE